MYIKGYDYVGEYIEWCESKGYDPDDYHYDEWEEEKRNMAESD